MQSILIIGIGLSIPVLWASLGELIAEQSGVINPGVEGVMLIGALAVAMAYHATHNVLVSVLIATVAGAVSGLPLAYLYVYRGANQVVTGILFNVFALGATTTIFVDRAYLARTQVPVAPPKAIPVLSDIPFFGDILFNQSVFVYVSWVAVLGVFFLMRSTWPGLPLRAAGEDPVAVEAAGMNVWRLRFWAVVGACALGGVGGAALVAAVAGGFSAAMTTGQGFVAMGVVVLARWNAFGALAAAALFGVAHALQFEAQHLAGLDDVPVEVWQMFPYVVTIVAVVIVGRGSRYPAACLVPYLPRKRRSSSAANEVLVEDPGLVEAVKA